MFERNLNIKKRITEIVQGNYSDLDIIRDKPMVFKSGKYNIVVDFIRWYDHPLFIKQLAKIILKHYEVFSNLEFLSNYDYKDESVVKTLIEKVTMFNANKNYKKLVNNIYNFIRQWATAYKKVKNDLKRIKFKKKIFDDFKIDEIIYIFFVIIVYNYDIVKKKSLRILELFQTPKKSQMEKSTTGSKSKVIPMPKYDKNPYPRSTLQLFGQQSKIEDTSE